MSRADASALAAQGFKVFPIAPGKKAPPLWADWPARADATVPEDWPEDANVGVHCDGMIVLDIDTGKGGDESLAALELLYDLPPTRTVRTPSGGRHLYYAGPSVGNSVGKLGRGIDVRSSRGYVVAPGSRTDAGAYEWADERDVAPAPDWLVAKLGTVVPKTATAAPVADAPTEVVWLASDWLERQEPAIEGEGGDLRTFVVACKLRDYGLSARQAFDLLCEGWNDTCLPPWPLEELRAKVEHAYRYGQNPPGAKVALPADFPVVDTPPRPRVVRRATLLSDFAKSENKGPGYVIKGLLQRRSYAAVYGAPGEGKTFVALDMAYHVAAGTPWMERKVHQGPVLYLAFEGTGGLVKRAQALRQRYGEADVPLYISGAAFDLRAPEGRAALRDLLADLPAKPVLIVIDTFARALMGGDENSAQDVGAFNSAVAALIESTGACVCIIHHSGKDKTKGARGSSALLGALDTEIEVDSGNVTATKQRDVEIGEPIGFKLAPLVVGIDEDGDDQTSCVVEPQNAAPQKRVRLTGNTLRGFQVLCDKWPSNEPVHLDSWKEHCREFLPKAGVSQRFFDIKRKLLEANMICEDVQGRITRRLE